MRLSSKENRSGPVLPFPREKRKEKTNEPTNNNNNNKKGTEQFFELLLRAELHRNRLELSRKTNNAPNRGFLWKIK